jgi:hypothetical protein
LVLPTIAIALTTLSFPFVVHVHVRACVRFVLLFFSSCFDLQTDSTSAGKRPTLVRGTNLRMALSAYGVVRHEQGVTFIFVVAISPRESNTFWRLYRSYSDFQKLRQDLIAQVLGS